MKHPTRLLLLAALLLGPAPAVAAEPDVDRRLADFNRRATTASANAFFRQLDSEGFTDSLIQYPRHTPADTLQMQVHYWAAEYLYDRQRYAEAERHALQALPLFRAGNNRGGEADCLNLLAVVCIRLADYGRAAQYAKRVHQLDLAAGDPDNISSSLNTLAAIYMSARQPKEAERYILKGISYAQKAGNAQRLAVLLGMASEVYHKLGDYQKSLDYATRAYAIDQQAGRRDKAAIRQSQRASALIALHRGHEAMPLLTEAIAEFRSGAANRHSLAIACCQMGRLLLQAHNDTAAIPYLNEALQIFTGQHDLYNESLTHKMLYEALRTTDPAQAMQHNDRYIGLRDSFYDSQTGELLTRYAAEYGYDELKAENASQRSAHRLTVVIALAIALVAITAWVLSRRSQRRRTRELLARIDELASPRYRQPAGVTAPTDEALRQCRVTDPTPAPPLQGRGVPCGGAPSPGEGGHEAPDPTSVQDRQFLLDVMASVNSHFATGNLDLESISASLNMSVSTFRRRLVAATGESPKAFITAIQMQRAEGLLKQRPDLLIDDIARQCGYKDASSFTRAFKRAYGVAPTQYRA